MCTNSNHMEQSAGGRNAAREEMSEKQLTCRSGACWLIISHCVGHVLAATAHLAEEHFNSFCRPVN